jgi:endonuclease YncB( thermonuclease family)
MRDIWEYFLRPVWEYFRARLGGWLVAACFISLIVLPALGLALVSTQFPSVVSGKVKAVTHSGSLLVGEFPNPVSLWGVDVPEHGDPGRTELLKFLAELLRDQSIDCSWRFPDAKLRYVASCQLLDGRDVGNELIKAGHARKSCFANLLMR